MIQQCSGIPVGTGRRTKKGWIDLQLGMLTSLIAIVLPTSPTIKSFTSNVQDILLPFDNYDKENV